MYYNPFNILVSSQWILPKDYYIKVILFVIRIYRLTQSLHSVGEMQELIRDTFFGMTHGKWIHKMKQKLHFITKQSQAINSKS